MLDYLISICENSRHWWLINYKHCGVICFSYHFFICSKVITLNLFHSISLQLVSNVTIRWNFSFFISLLFWFCWMKKCEKRRSSKKSHLFSTEMQRVHYIGFKETLTCLRRVWKGFLWRKMQKHQNLKKTSNFNINLTTMTNSNWQAMLLAVFGKKGNQYL